MGRGTIVGGGTDGLFTVRVDYGKAPRDAMVFVLTLRINELTARIGEQTTKLEQAQANTQAARAAAAAAVSEYASAATADPGGNHSALIVAVNAATVELGRRLTIEAGVRVPLELLKADRTEQQRERGRLESAVVEETRAAWCVDLTESAAGSVATIEVPGENQAILIAPGCRAPADADGQLTAREIMSPAQAFWNAAVLPGWQKWKPTYRKGAITAINKLSNRASVALDAATSSAAGLGVNQASTLAGVPVLYMGCHAEAFEVGDRVVVEFVGMEQDNPRVIGFVDHPKSCTKYLVAYSVGGHVLDGTGAGIYEPGPTISGATMQMVYRNQMATTVIASTPTATQVFIGWTDGNSSLSRTDGPITGPVSQQASYLQLMYEFGVPIVGWYDEPSATYYKSVSLADIGVGYTGSSFTPLSSASPIPNSELIGKSITLTGNYGGGSYARTYTCFAAGVGAADFRMA